MAKQKEEKTNVMRILEQKGIPYTPHTYPHEDGVAVDGVSVARSLGQDPGVRVQDPGGPGDLQGHLCV